jgi:hypothetical protein
MGQANARGTRAERAAKPNGRNTCTPVGGKVRVFALHPKHERPGAMVRAHNGRVYFQREDGAMQRVGNR